jgi:hypothetical protein
MRFCIMIFSFLTASCSPGLGDTEVLSRIVDDRGRTRRLVVTGYIPGEDTFLNIIKYDSAGNAFEKYGVRPYGNKFKEISKFDLQNRLIELIIYKFEEEFENYRTGTERYTLADTIADFTVTDEDIESKMVFEFNDSSDNRREIHYRAVVDSLTNYERLEVVLDTIW